MEELGGVTGVVIPFVSPRRSAPAGRVMLAVLLFGNLSGAPDEEYFSDGMTEEMRMARKRL